MAVRNHAVATLLAAPVCLMLTLDGCGNAREESSTPGAGLELASDSRARASEGLSVGGGIGLLGLREGCLVLGGDVVFWPYGATWDEDAKAVLFQDAPQFEDATPARVGAVFTGGGGWYPADTNFRSWRGDEFADPIEECQKATHTQDVVYAYPAASP